MKLAGPAGLKVRFVVGYRTVAIVTGVFPPELAPRWRAGAEVLANMLRPTLRTATERATREWISAMERETFGIYDTMPWAENPTNGP